MKRLSVDPPANSKAKGFSLIEALVSIAVIAIIAGIAIPVISAIFSQSQDTAARRNAQMIAGVANSASAAGNTQIASAPDKETAVDLLVAGVNGEGQFANNIFIVNLNNKDREKTLSYLEFKDGLLAFDPETD